MTKLTDDQLGNLLRETFAGKEELIDSLPEATVAGKHRMVPVLVAAASVLVVLSGILFAVQASDRAAPVAGTTATDTPGSTTTAAQAPSDNGLIWGAAIAEILKAGRPADGWSKVWISGVTNPSARLGGFGLGPSQGFTEAERQEIESALGGVPVQWFSAVFLGCGGPSVEAPYVTVSPIVKKQGQVEVSASFKRGCERRALTYRLKQRGGTWTVTGTVS